MNLAELKEAYKARKLALDSAKKEEEKYKALLKDAMLEAGESDYTDEAGYRFERIVQERKSMDEEKLLAELRERNLTSCIATKEVVDEDATLKAVEAGELPQEVLADSTMGKAGEINPLGCDNENISYNSLMEIMGVVSERLQANTDTIKHDMINWLTKLRKQLLEANGGHTEADLQRELSRKSKLLDAYLDGILNKQEYQKKAEELDERIIQLKAETEKNKANSGDIAEIDKVLANIDEEVSRYVDGNKKLKVEYLLEHLEQVQIFPDKVIVIVPILSEGIVVEKTQYVSREKWNRKDNAFADDHGGRGDR